MDGWIDVNEEGAANLCKGLDLVSICVKEEARSTENSEI